MYLTPYFTSCHLTFVKLSWKFLSFFLNSLNVKSTSPPYKGSSQIWLVPDFLNIHDENAVICDKEQRRIQNSVKHLRWSFLQKPLITFTKSFILDVWLGSEYASEVCNVKQPKNITTNNLFCIVAHHCTAIYGIGLLHMCDINFGHILSLNIKF